MEIEGYHERSSDDGEAIIGNAFDLIKERESTASTLAAGVFPSPRVALARRIYQARRLRAGALSVAADLFQDPAWDLLLDLYIAHVERREVAVTSACIAANVPPTTALRWISALVQRGLVERASDPNDRRRILLRLSNAGQAAMEQYLETV